MREIKFRAWSKIDMCIVTIEEINFHKKWVAIPINDGDGGYLEQRKFDDVILMQFTGLLDKNGKEIYEGDIVRDITYSRIAKVEWETPEFVAWNSNWNLLSLNGKDCEIIGNIFENPELLK